MNSRQSTVTTKNKGAAATQELAIKEKVVQEPEEHADDEEIPQLVPMQINGLAQLKVIVSLLLNTPIKTKYFKPCK